MESQTRGRTKWKRFAVVMVPSVAATAAIGVALGQGALAASFSVSGQQFKVTTERLDGEGFSQYGSVDVAKDGSGHPVAVSAFNSAKIKNMCQSVVVPAPGIGDITMVLKAGGEEPVEAKNLYLDVTDLDADATFNNVDIGVAAGDIAKGPQVKQGDKVDAGSFAQQAESVTLTDVKQQAWATTAGTFKLSGLKMSLAKGKQECY
jgi:Family of unknown function (DUF6230)